MARAKEQGAEPQQMRCTDCFRESQFQRHLHFLQFRNATDLTEHLNGQHPKNAKGEYQEKWAKDSGIDGVIRWYISTSRLYSNLVDAQGIPLPPWKGWMESQIEAAKQKRKLQRTPDQELSGEDLRRHLANLVERFSLDSETFTRLIAWADDVPF